MSNEHNYAYADVVYECGDEKENLLARLIVRCIELGNLLNSLPDEVDDWECYRLQRWANEICELAIEMGNVPASFRYMGTLTRARELLEMVADVTGQDIALLR